ncbi:MAG: xanthine dehydrogenase family protein molybdopterin-binding subunit [Deltaproteobacteria bacterium]|nr:MAG: xanthine dehydrogenase family protein molybdopterin-binding subunit [Deltaproteobacteria bacterium]
MRKRGKGLSSIGYITGFFGGGDPNQAQISLKMDGTFNLMMGTVDIGQGSKTALSQIAAEEMDVPVEAITYTNSDTDIVPFCMGAFASRATFIGGNAILDACRDLKRKMKEFVSAFWKVKADDLVVEDNQIFLKNDPQKKMSMGELGAASTFGGAYLTGLGAYRPDGPFQVDPVTGAMPVLCAASFATTVVEVEVDTETGGVEVIRSTQAYEIGKAISPLMCRGQINGGVAMGIGMALTESVYPYWPSGDLAVDNFGDYVLATAADMPEENRFAILEVPHPDGPYGAKGFSEMGANAMIPAITSAIHDAIGVWITEFPTTPELVLRALADKKK